MPIAYSGMSACRAVRRVRIRSDVVSVNRGVPRVIRDDRGMTLVEVVVAIVIFFFVLTAIFGLLGATTSMSVLSNERALLTNAMNSYIEEVRSLPYTSVGVDAAGVPVPGVLAAETVVSAEAYDVVIVPTVTWVNDPQIPGSTNYKQLSIQGSIMRGGEVVYTLSMSTFIREEAGSGEYIPPTITFGPNSPADATPPTVVRGRAVPIDAIAETTMPGARLIAMSFQVSPGGIYLRNQSGGSALWELDAPSATKTFYWDTLALNEDGEPFVTDGEYTITVEVVDSNQKRVYQTRRVFIDNDPPDPPSDLVASAGLSGTQVPLTWTTSMDGRSQSDHYVLLVGRQDLDGTWTEGETLTSGPSGSHTLVTAPFSRYAVRVAAESRDWLRSDWHPSADAGEPPVSFVTRPLLNGRYNGVYEKAGKARAWDVDLEFTVTPPTFPTYDLSFALMERSGTGAWVEVSRNSTGVFTRNITVAAANANPITVDQSFKVVASYRAEPLGTLVLTESNTLGPLSLPSAGWREFPSPGVW